MKKKRSSAWLKWSKKRLLLHDLKPGAGFMAEAQEVLKFGFGRDMLPGILKVDP